MWIWKKKPPSNENHLLYWLCYWHIGTEDGWIYYKTRQDQIEFEIVCKILKKMGYIEWQQK